MNEPVFRSKLLVQNLHRTAGIVPGRGTFEITGADCRALPVLVAFGGRWLSDGGERFLARGGGGKLSSGSRSDRLVAAAFGRATFRVAVGLGLAHWDEVDV